MNEPSDSEKRAASVRDYLVQQDTPIASVSIMGFGKTQRLASIATAAGRQQNRRVELRSSAWRKTGRQSSDGAGPPDAASDSNCGNQTFRLSRIEPPSL